MSDLAIGIDVGGTSIRAGVVDRSGTVLETLRAPTSREVAALEAGIDGLIAQLRDRHRVDAVGLAVAGFVNPSANRVTFAPHLPWRDREVAAALQDRLGVRAILEHDANAAAWAEYRFGAAARGKVSAVISIGTGIGVGLLIDGAIYRGAFGVAPEIGHLQVVPGGRRCPCGKSGCLERYCSGTGLVDTALELIDRQDVGRKSVLGDIANGPAALTGRRIAGAAAAGDTLATAAIAEFARWLGLAIALVSDVLDPDLVVIGGGVGEAAGLFLDDAREHYLSQLTGAGHRQPARVRAAQLGEAAGIVGAADLVRRS